MCPDAEKTPQLLPPQSATGNATGAQPNSVKALAAVVLERNRQRNSTATSTEKTLAPRSQMSTRRPITLQVKNYAGAQINRLTSDWIAGDTTADQEIEKALPILRRRARDLERNNDYIRRYFNLLCTNVLGHAGIGLQVRVRDKGNKLNRQVNDLIEGAWKLWGRKGCTVCGRYTWQDVQHLVLRAVARDGEILIHIPKRWDGNKAGFALQLLDADLLDIHYNDQFANGNTVRMGVECDPYKRVVAYHILDRHPSGYASYSKGWRRKSYPTEEILHIRRPERAEETRSVPWIASVSWRLRLIAAAEEAETVSWRAGACQMGFLIKGEEANFDDREEDEQGNSIIEAEPGILGVLEPGWDFKGWNPDKPSSTVESFLKAELRGVASGLNVSYVALSNNLEGVSYSSIRSGENADRDHWRVLQVWLIQHLCQEVFERWLLRVLTNGFVSLPTEQFDRYNAPVWRPRGWEWVDPLNEARAAEIDIRLGVDSVVNIAARKGYDVEELQEDNKLTAQLGIVPPTAKQSSGEDTDGIEQGTIQENNE